jgi:hypothetical protein
LKKSKMAMRLKLITKPTSGIDIKFNPLPDFAIEIINAGGLLEHIKRTTD